MESFKKSWALLNTISDGKTPFRDSVIEAQNYVQSIERVLLHGFNFDLVVDGHVIDFVSLIDRFDKTLPPGYLQLPKSLNHRERTRAWIRLRLNDSTLSKSFLSLISLEPEVLGIYYKPWAFLLSENDAKSVLAHLDMSESRSLTIFDFSPEDPSEFSIQSSLSDFLLSESGPPVTVVVSKKKKKKRTAVAIADEDGDGYSMANSVSVSGSVARRLKKRHLKKHAVIDTPVQSSSPGVAGSYKEKIPHGRVAQPSQHEDDMAKSLDPSLFKKPTALRVASNINSSISASNFVDEVVAISPGIVDSDRVDRLRVSSSGISEDDDNDDVDDDEKSLLCSSVEIDVNSEEHLEKLHSEETLPTLDKDSNKPQENEEEKPSTNPFVENADDFVIVSSSISKPLSCSPKRSLAKQLQQETMVEVSNSFDDRPAKDEGEKIESNITAEVKEDATAISSASASLAETIGISSSVSAPQEPFPKSINSPRSVQFESEYGRYGGIEKEDDDDDGNSDEDLNSIFTMHVKSATVIPDYESEDKKCTLYTIAKNRVERIKANERNGKGSNADTGNNDDADDDDFSQPKYVAPDGWCSKLDEINFYVFPQPPKPLETVCYGCKAPLSKFFFDPPRYCGFTGHFFCSKCHSGERYYIPSQIVWNWDLEEYPINNVSYEYLRKNFEAPLVDLQAVNPELYESVPVLKDLKILRKKLFYMKDYITCCTKIGPNDKAKVFLEKIPKYYYKKFDLFSLRDFVQLSVIVDDLMRVMDAWLSHIRSCQLCLNMGSYCEICHSKTPIHMFQLRDSIQCEVCHGIFHKSCFCKEYCPKCKRRKARLIINSN